MANIATLSVLLALDDKVSAGLQGAATRLDQFGAQARRAGMGLAGIAAPLTGIGLLAIKAASDFESSFAGVRKTVNATEEEFAALAAGLRSMSKEIPVSVNELNRIGEAAGQLGIRKEAILGFTRTVADLAATTNLASDEAATALARIANITGLPQDSFDRLGSTVVALGNKLATTEREIVEFGLRIAGAGKLAGLTEAQIMAIGGAMSSVGVQAEAGGTAVQKVLIDIQRAVATTGPDLAVFASTAGMSAEEFASAWKEDAGGAFTTFVEGLGAAGDDAFDILERLGLQDQRLLRSFLSLAGAGGLLRESMDLGTKAFKENTALTEEAQKRYDTFASKLTIAKNKAIDMAITVGLPLVDALKDLLDKINPAIEAIGRLAAKFAEFAKAHPGWVLAIMGLVAALGAVATALIGIGLILPGLSAAFMLFAAVLSTPFLPLLATLAAIYVMIASIRAAVESFNQELSSFRPLDWKWWTEDPTKKAPAVTAFDIMKRDVADIMGLLSGLIPPMEKAGAATANLGQGFSLLGGNLAGVGVPLDVVTSATDQARGATDTFKETLDQTLNKVQDFTTAILGQPPALKNWETGLSGVSGELETLEQRLAMSVEAGTGASKRALEAPELGKRLIETLRAMEAEGAVVDWGAAFAAAGLDLKDFIKGLKSDLLPSIEGINSEFEDLERIARDSMGEWARGSDDAAFGIDKVTQALRDKVEAWNDSLKAAERETQAVKDAAERQAKAVEEAAAREAKAYEEAAARKAKAAEDAAAREAAAKLHMIMTTVGPSGIPAIPVPTLSAQWLSDYARRFNLSYEKVAEEFTDFPGIKPGLLQALLGTAGPNLPIEHGGAPSLQHGIKGFSGGLALVGERGPELVSLPRGADVTPIGAVSVGAINIYPPSGDPIAIAEQVRREIESIGVSAIRNEQVRSA